MKLNFKELLLKATRKASREDPANLNQKASVFGDKRLKRQKTRERQLKEALKGEDE